MLSTVGIASDGISRFTGTVIMRSYCCDDVFIVQKYTKNRLLIYTKINIDIKNFC